MTRPLRLEFEGALYHVISRGDRREPIFEDDEDRRVWLDLFAEALDSFHATAYAYCLMGNHYHPVVHQGGIRQQRFRLILMGDWCDSRNQSTKQRAR